jgi:hypothetical protein
VEPVLLLSFLLILVALERTAAMRGAGGRPLSDTANIALRLYFLFIIALPFAMWDWRLAVPFLLYAPSYASLAELRGGRPGANAYLRTWRIWRWIGSYFSLGLVKTAEIDPRKTYIIGLHPHGILPVGTMVNIATDVSGFRELFPGINMRGLAASFCFYVPLYRWVGHLFSLYIYIYIYIACAKQQWKSLVFFPLFRCCFFSRLPFLFRFNLPKKKKKKNCLPPPAT